MIRNSAKLTALAVATLIGSVATVNCSKNSTGEDKNVGHVNLALTVPSGAKVNSFHYKITGGTPMGIADVDGDINTSDPNATATAYQSFPASMGNTVTLTATTTAGESCSGTSMPFNVQAGGVAMVDVTLICGGTMQATGSGSVSIKGTIVEGDDCPVLTAWSASPLQTSLGGKIDVAGAATDADVGVIAGETLTYAWTGGMFDNAAAASTKFTCTVSGTNTITLTVSDNHVPTPCSATVSIPVTCIGGTVCGNGVVEAGEQCEGLGTYTPGVGICDATCHYAPPVCNNGKVETGEQCDPPNGTTCSATCQNQAPPAVCGNGVTEAPETCDDNNTANGDGCSSTCTVEVPTESACMACERNATNVAGTCFQTSTTANAGTNDWTKFGCNGFTGTDKTNCTALLSCMRTNNCGAGSDPTPCLCGNLSATTCATTAAASLPGVCKNAYIAAANGGDVFGLFFSTDSPIGVANNLYTCDKDAPCSCP
jgi:cysteine-rich repeat protein